MVGISGKHLNLASDQRLCWLITSALCPESGQHRGQRQVATSQHGGDYLWVVYARAARAGEKASARPGD